MFGPLDTCVTPVLSLAEAAAHPHNAERGVFVGGGGEGGVAEPAPSPRLSETPARPGEETPCLGQHTREILGELGYEEEAVKRLHCEMVVNDTSS